MRKPFRTPLLALIAAIAIYTSYAYASSEAASPGAEGVSAISGWNISGIQYSSEEGSSNNSIVEFDLDAPANSVEVSVKSSSALFYDCSNTMGTHWYCVIGPEVGVSEFDELRVIAR